MSEVKVFFSVAEDEKLVEIVSKFPVIYDLSSPLFKNQTVKDSAWKEIAELVERTVDDCKKRWRNIKDTYYKRQRRGKGTGTSALSKPKKWALADMLTFLKKVDHKRKSISNVQYEESDNEGSDDAILSDIPETETQCTRQSVNTKDNPSQNVEDILSFRPQSKRVRYNDKIVDMLESRRIERQKIINTLTEEKSDDATDLFFKSIASSIKKRRPDLINEAKMKSLQMVIDLESRTSSSVFTSLSAHSPSSSTYSSKINSPTPSLMNGSTTASNEKPNEFDDSDLYSTFNHYEQL